MLVKSNWRVFWSCWQGHSYWHGSTKQVDTSLAHPGRRRHFVRERRQVQRLGHRLWELCSDLLMQVYHPELAQEWDLLGVVENENFARLDCSILEGSVGSSRPEFGSVWDRWSNWLLQLNAVDSTCLLNWWINKIWLIKFDFFLNWFIIRSIEAKCFMFLREVFIVLFQFEESNLKMNKKGRNLMS